MNLVYEVRLIVDVRGVVAVVDLDKSYMDPYLFIGELSPEPKFVTHAYTPRIQVSAEGVGMEALKDIILSSEVKGDKADMHSGDPAYDDIVRTMRDMTKMKDEHGGVRKLSLSEWLKALDEAGLIEVPSIDEAIKEAAVERQ